MSATNWTRHARQRSSQRAIPEFHLELLQAFGESVEQKGGFTVLRLDEKGQERLRRQLADVLARWDQLRNVYAVIAPGGRIVTVAHSKGHARRCRPRGRFTPRKRRIAATGTFKPSVCRSAS